MDPAQMHRLGAGDASSRKFRSQRSKETRREREFYSYFDSVLANVRTKPQLCDLHDPEAVAAHQAKASVDTTLTAFTQLAALRLHAKRSMIFFFDAEYAYVMAESTQSLSLCDDTQHDPGDSLWLGFTKVPRGLSVCEVTTDLPTNSGSNAEDPRTASIVHIINNLTEDTRFCDRPYVLDGPRARFYAGVPITTPNGVNIGALCVLDDKPRDGLSLLEIQYLRDIAGSVMDHLDLIRAKEDNQRSHNMTTALGAFMEGKSELDQWWHNSAPTQDRRNARRPMRPSFGPISPPATSPDDDIHSAKIDYFPLMEQSKPYAGVPATERTLHLPATQSEEPSKTDSCGSVNGLQPSAHKKSDASGPTTAGPPPEKNTLTMQIKSTVTRAAGLVRAGIRADRVVFLDATVGTFGGLVASTQGLSQTETDTDPDGRSHVVLSSHTGNREEEQINLSTEEEDDSTHSVVLGSSHSPNLAPHMVHQPRVKSRDLKTLLRHYPHGQIWHFNSDGHTSDDEDFSSNSAGTFASTVESAHSETGQPPTPSGRRTMKRSQARMKDALLIRKTFPGVRSALLLGMWDPQQERWYGAAIALSYAPTRIFSADSELKYAAAFCDVLQGEIWRLEAQELGRAKNQFISSISHELRSPLHGIILSAEVLADQEEDSLKAEMIRSITVCGSTLLDVVNDLLDYSGLNQDSRIRRKMRPSKTLQPSPPADSIAMLSTLTEDAIEAACLGHRHKYRADPNQQYSAIVTLDLESLNAADWLGSTTIGSWKRVVLNLTTNALKYCPKGYISISLKRKSTTRPSATASDETIELVVEDSGIGMTEEFQTRSLFRPFQQEDKLSPGTGLGLNLVAQIVKSLNGTVHVQSTKGVGTTVTVALPARRALAPSPSLPAASVAPPFNVSLVGFNAGKASLHNGLSRLLLSLKQCAKQLGGSPSVRNDFSDAEAAMYIVHEDKLQDLYGRLKHSAAPPFLDMDRSMRPVITICHTQPSAFAIQSSPIAQYLPPGSQFLWLPIGPAKLAAAISTILKPDAEGVSSATNRSDMTPTGPVSLDKSMERSGYFTGNEEITKGGRNGIERLAIRDRACVPTHARSRSVPTNAPATQDDASPGAPVPRAVIPSLLLVEDNAINLRLLEVFAKRARHEHVTARDGKEAVEAYKKVAREHLQAGDASSTTVLDIIILDLNMPVMDGFQAARAIRRFESDHQVPRATIIAVTGLGDATAHDEAFESGMDMFLTKPVRMKELAEIIAKIRKV